MLQNIGQTLFYHFGEQKKISLKFQNNDLIPEFIDPTYMYVINTYYYCIWVSFMILTAIKNNDWF